MRIVVDMKFDFATLVVPAPKPFAKAHIVAPEGSDGSVFVPIFVNAVFYAIVVLLNEFNLTAIVVENFFVVGSDVFGGLQAVGTG